MPWNAPATPDAFAAKWGRAKLKERSAAYEHLLDLCRLLNGQAQPSPFWRCGSPGFPCSPPVAGESVEGGCSWSFPARRRSFSSAFSRAGLGLSLAG